MPAIGNTDEIVAAIGYSSFELLVRVRGGRRLYVPTDLASAQQLVQWLGQEKALVLIKSFGGFAIDIPNRRPFALPSRRPVIDALIAAGKSDAEISEMVECTERAVRRYRTMKREALPGFNPGAAR